MGAQIAEQAGGLLIHNLEVEMAEVQEKPKSGGPLVCPKGECGECLGRPHHHWMEAIPQDPDYVEDYGVSQDPWEREMLAVGVEAGFICKHCEAWVEMFDDADGDDMDPDDAWELSRGIKSK
jgi:hypothetical protein